MRRLPLLLVALLGACVHTVGGTVPPPGANNGVAAFSGTTTCTAGTCTGSAPTDTTTGLELAGTQGFRLTVCAPSGQTLSGAGALNIYLCDAAKGVCARNPSLDKSISVTSTSCAGSACRCQAFPDFQVAVVPWVDQTVVAVPNGVTVSSGTPLAVYLDPGGPK